MKQTEKAYKSPQDQKSKPRLNASAKESAESNSKKDLHALTNSELRYRRLFEAAQDGILILDAETGTITDVNPFLIEMLGYSHEEFMEKKLWDVGAFNDIGVSRDGFRKLQENEYIRYEDLPLKAKDGRLVRVEFVSNVYLVGDKKVIQCNIRDITEHKQAEKALQESNEILRALVNSSPLAIIALDPDGHVTQWNPAAERMFGWKESEVLGNFLPIVSEDKRNENRALRERVLLGEGFTDVQARRRKKDGSPIDISISTAPIHDSQGQVIGIISVSADITERKKAEQLLEERDVLLNEVGAIAKIGGWEMDMATGKATWSKGTYDIVEIDYDKPIPGLYEHIGYYLPEYRKMVEKKMKALIETRQPMQFEVALKTQKGNSKWCQAFGEAVVKDGELIKLRGTFQDITERKRAEQALAESETKFRWLYEYAPSAYHLLTSEGIITDVNRRWCELLGYCREEVIGKSIFDFVIEEEKEEAKASFEKKKQSGQSYVEGSERGFVTKDGAVRTFKTYDFFVMDQNQNLTSVQTTIEDITEHKRADEALKHSESSLAEAQKLTHIGSAEVDIQTDACIFSDEHFRIWGYEPGEMKPSYNFLVNSIHPDDRGEFIQRLQDTIEGQKPLEMEARVIRPDGSIRFVYFRTDVHRNPEGKAGRLMGTAQDITERRQAEKILIDSETRLTEAQRIAHLGNWDWDIE
ncbi:MAG: PAS domain S-box protein, partial [Candidatus Latescibacterota bacterium]